MCRPSKTSNSQDQTQELLCVFVNGGLRWDRALDCGAGKPIPLGCQIPEEQIVKGLRTVLCWVNPLPVAKNSNMDKVVTKILWSRRLQSIKWLELRAVSKELAVSSIQVFRIWTLLVQIFRPSYLKIDNSRARQCSLGGLAFLIGSVRPSHPLIAFECIAVLPPSVSVF